MTVVPFLLHAYAGVGQAVLAGQHFETILIVIFEVFKMETDPDYRKGTGGYVLDEKFKTVVANVVRVLRERGSIAPDLENRITSYIDDRNLLVHRWVRLHGWPSMDDPESIQRLLELAGRLTNEARDLGRILVNYVLKYGAGSKTRDELQQRMAETFQRAHLEDMLTPEQLEELIRRYGQPLS